MSSDNVEMVDYGNVGVSLEEHAEPQDIMYENTADLEPPRRNDPTPTTGQGSRLMEGIQKRSLYLCPVSLLVCLLLSVAVIVLLVKYIELSSEFKNPETNYHRMDSNVTETLGSEEEFLAPQRTELVTTKTEQKTRAEGYTASMSTTPMGTNDELEETILKLEKALHEITDLKNSLLHYQQNEQNATAKILAMEEVMKNAKLQMSQWDREFCPKGWVHFRKTCLWISVEKRTWKNSEEDCEEKDSNLLIVLWNDTALQRFMAEIEDGFWVGKEMTWRWPDEWKWPDGYQPSRSSDDCCWMTSGGNLQNVSCSHTNRWICERNLVLASYKASSYSSLEFDLWKAVFSCYRKSS